MDINKSVFINIDFGKIDVKFKGKWRRVDVDHAYQAMMMELPRYIYQTLKGDKEKENGRE